MKTVDKLLKGETLIIDVKKVAGGKIQIQFGEIVRDPNRPIDAVGIFNASDERFTGPKARRAWMSAEPKEAKALIPQISDKIDACLAEEDGEAIECNYLNPTVGGERLRLQVRETTVGTDWQMKNLERAAKYSPSNQRYLFHNKKSIFSRAVVVIGEPRHTFLETTETSEYADGRDLQVSQHLVEPQPVEETVKAEADEKESA
jgi:hypothetical protein